MLVYNYLPTISLHNRIDFFDRPNITSRYMSLYCLHCIATKGEKRITYLYRPLQFSCCGINGSNNYGISRWRLQEVDRRELVVPLSCCTLNNANETDSFLNPVPANLTLCQTLNPAEHQYARHTVVCYDNEEVIISLCCAPPCLL